MYLGLIVSKRRLGCKTEINKAFPDAYIGDFIFNVVRTKKGEYHYSFTKINNYEWAYKDINRLTQRYKGGKK